VRKLLNCGSFTKAKFHDTGIVGEKGDTEQYDFSSLLFTLCYLFHNFDLCVEYPQRKFASF
jgi:hypothetical protein